MQATITFCLDHNNWFLTRGPFSIIDPPPSIFHIAVRVVFFFFNVNVVNLSFSQPFSAFPQL